MKTVLRSLSILLVFFLSATAVFAGIRKGPYLLFEGSSTSMSVLWQTDGNESNTIRWGTDTSYSMGNTAVGVYGSDFQHKHVITGLQPGTKYYYQVDGYGSGSFRTAPAASATAVKLLAYGDSRSNPASHETVANRMRARYAADPALQTIVLHDGDFVGSETEADWTAHYFVSGASYPQMHALQAEMPMMGARGNHEGAGAVYQKYFPYPYVGGYYWSFDYGPVHVVVLDEYTSYSAGSAQYNWLVNDLASTTKPWKILLTHEPGWGAGTHGNNADIQNIIHPLCQQYGVDLFVNGHNHNYARALVNGLNYVTTGGGGASLYTPDPSYPNIVTVDKSYHYTEIDINDTTLTMTARRADGSVIETISVSHGGNQPPVANAGPDQSVTDSDGNGSQSVTLNGSGSSDPDGTIASYVWKEGTTQIATGAAPAVTLAVGIHTLTLTVTDNGGASATDTVVVTVNAGANQPPTANAGPDQTVTDSDGNGSQSVTLNGSASSDPDGTISSYVWKEGSTQIATGATPAVTLAVGSHTLTLTVTDNGGATATDTVVVTVNVGGGSGGNPVTVNSRVNASSDDAEERESGGTVGLTSSDLELVFDTASTGNQYVGMRFTNVNVPQGATITNAYIQFTVDEANSGATSLTIKGQAADNPATFTTTAYNVSSRPTTNVSVAWAPAAWNTVGAAGADQRTPDIKGIVQEIVGRAGWAQNNSMAFIVSGTGERTAEAYNGSAAQAPELVITYTTGGAANQPPVANAGADQSVTDGDGNGSESVTLNGSASSDPDGTIASWVWTEGATQIATGATPAVTLAVGSHTLTLTATDNGGATATDTVVVTVNPAANQPPVADAGADQSVTDSDGNGSQSVTLNGTGSSDPDGTIASWVWKDGTTQIATGATPAVTLAVGSHTITLTVTDNAGATDTDTVVVTVNAGGGSPTTATSRVSAGSDDAEEQQSGGSMYLTSSDLEVVFDTASTGNQYVGMRFNNVNVPKGATITNAYIQFTVDEVNSGATSLTVKGQAADNPGTFTTAAYNVSSRATTAASVAWNPVAWNTVGTAGVDQQTPDIKSIVQEIVGRAGWAQNNSMAFIVTGTGERTAEAYEGSASQAPLLVITYQ